mmetsp:Transcript_22331/g.55698  ORF Transcript_22331/g.55698 Transcript_22331/m.55698 type:complete len:262 (-) Transcript_22331:364-1149(-)
MINAELEYAESKRLYIIKEGAGSDWREPENSGLAHAPSFEDVNHVKEPLASPLLGRLRHEQSRVRRALRVHAPPVDVVPPLEFDRPVGRDEGVGVVGVPVERGRGHRVEAAVPVHGSAAELLRLHADADDAFVGPAGLVVSQSGEGARDCLCGSRRVRLGGLVALRHLELVPLERAGKVLCHALEPGLQRHDLLGHVGRDARVQPRRARDGLLEEHAVASRRTHDKVEAVARVPGRVDVDGARVRVVDADQAAAALRLKSR